MALLESLIFFIFSTDPATNEQWLEVHKLPKEQWFKEADGLASSRRQAEAKRAAAAVSSVTMFRTTDFMVCSCTCL